MAETKSNPNGPAVRGYIYRSLGSINEGTLRNVGNTPYMGTQIIPIDATMGYESLTHMISPTPSSYFEIESAYPSFPRGTCTRFVLRKCDGTVDNRYITDSLPAAQ
jgi:hypothetical protein